MTKSDAKEVLQLLLKEVIQKVQDQRGVTIQVDAQCIDLLLDHGYSPEFGARELRRLVADTVETTLANMMLKKEWKRGDVITLMPDDLHI